MDTEACFKCENKKDMSDFTFRKDTQHYRNVCRKCNRERDNELIKQKFENNEGTDFPVELKCETCFK